MAPSASAAVAAHDLDDPEAEPLEEEHDDHFFADDVQMAGLEDDAAVALADAPCQEQELVSVSAARAATRSWRKQRDNIALSNRVGMVAAHGAVASTVAHPSLADALRAADSRESGGPEWAAFAHESHELYTIAGFVICARCGSRASRQIRVSDLTRPCKKRLSAYGRQGLNRLANSRCPTDGKGSTVWPDGSTQEYTPDVLRRIRR